MGNGGLQLAVLGAVLIASSAQAQDQGSWTKKAPLPAAINEMQLVFAAGKLHALGGGVLGYSGPYHEEYDIRNDKWRPLARVPRSLDHGCRRAERQNLSVWRVHRGWHPRRRATKRIRI